MRYLLLSFSIFVSLPQIASAVEITEVAWMGSSDSANHEWIELYNDGSSIDVSGWTLTDNNSLSITLSGTIAAGNFAVLERTSDASAAGSAFLIYTGALVNGGTTLTLRDANGDIVDQVAGGSDWENIGGDNDTKETAQKGATGWFTGAATPGAGASGVAAPVTSADDEPTANTDDNTATQTTTNNNTSQDSSDGEAIVLTLPDVTLQLTVIAPTFAHVNQPIDFRVMPSDVGETFIDSLAYTWNFGDGTTNTGKEPTHIYRYPGRYVVVVEGGYKRQQQVTRVEIDVLPVQLVLAQSGDGSVTIANESDSEIDLGGYRLVGHDTFALPKYTILLPGQEITIPAQQLQTDTALAMLALYDQSGTAVATMIPGRVSTPVLALTSDAAASLTVALPTPRISALTDIRVIDQSPTFVQPRTPQNDRFRFATTEPEQVAAAEGTPLLAPATALAAGDMGSTQVAQAAQTARQLPGQWPLYVLIGLLILGLLSIYLIPSYPRGKDPF